MPASCVCAQKQIMLAFATAGGEEHTQHWYDLCAGPHVESTGDINPAAIGLESVSPQHCADTCAPALLQTVGIRFGVCSASCL